MVVRLARPNQVRMSIWVVKYLWLLFFNFATESSDSAFF